VTTRPAVDVDVAIVGLGPVGAMAANLLGQRGIATFVCDREIAAHALPRALGLDHETMRILQSLGLADEVQPHLRVYPPTEYRGVDGRVISRFVSAPEPHPLGWAPNYTFDQPAFERVLRGGVDRHPSVEVALGWQLASLEQDADTVTLGLDGENGAHRDVTARYVIAADGGSSTVRRLLGITMESLDFDEPWLVIDVHCDDDAVQSLPACVIQYCEPSRPTTYVLGPGNHRRWEMMLLPGEDPAEVATAERVWQLLERWVTPQHASLWRHTTYVFHALVATSWRDRRVLLAGDAAHMTPPFMAQGMVQGIRDVLNLAWKLGLVLDGAPDALLDSYEAERRPHVRATSEAAKSLGLVICELDDDRARERDARLLAENGDPPTPRIRQNLIPGLAHGLIDATPAAGSLFPQPTVGSTERLDDVTGTGFRLFARDPLAQSLASTGEVAAALAAIRGLIVSIDELDEPAGVLDAWLRDHECEAVLVRPDHYVYGTAVDRIGAQALCTSVARRLGLTPAALTT